MKCYCCGKLLKNDHEFKTGWHDKCVKSFFGTNEFPEISLEEDVLNELATKNVNHGLTITGVQKKISLHLESDELTQRLTLVDYPTGYILKPQSSEFKQLPEFEHLAMSMARIVNIAVVPFGLVRVNSKLAYITKRIDRQGNFKLAMEDFCQLSGRMTDDKYKGSYEECGKVIKKYSTRYGIDISELYLRLVFCYVIGNSDMHLKNFSLIETAPQSREYVLSKAYDLLPVNVILPEDMDVVALTMNGKKRNLRKNDFLALANNFNLDEKIARRIIEKVISKKEEFIKYVYDSLLSNEYKESLIHLIENRISMLN